MRPSRHRHEAAASRKMPSTVLFCCAPPRAFLFSRMPANSLRANGYSARAQTLAFPLFLPFAAPCSSVPALSASASASASASPTVPRQSSKRMDAIGGGRPPFAQSVVRVCIRSQPP